MDIHATILDAAGLQHDSSNTPDGVSLLSMLRDQADGPNSAAALKQRSLYFHYPNYAFHKENRMASAIRRGPYKLLKFYDDDSVELYDLENDISEAKNLAKENPEKAKTMRYELEQWLKNVGASIPQHEDREQ